MTGRTDDSQVRVRRLTSGVVRIGPYLTSAAGVARLNLPGATALVDPLTPHGIPTLEVSDAFEAVDTVRALYGAEVADHLLLHDEDVQDAADVGVVASPQLRDLSHLGHLVWLSRSAPWPLPSPVLVAELIVAVDSCLDVLEGPHDVSQAIAGYSATMLTGLSGALEGHASPPVMTRLLDACSAVSHHLQVTDAARAQLLALIEAATRSTSNPGGRPGTTRPLLDACTPGAAVHAASTSQGALYSGSATAEWSRNSNGVVSRDEDAVLWTVDTEGAQGARVTVVATRATSEPPVGNPSIPPASADLLIQAVSDAGWRTSRGVACSFHTPAWPLPVTEVVLGSEPDTGNLAGSVMAHGPAADALRAALGEGRLVVDVHDLGHRHAHLAGGDPTVEAARRWTARALCATRVAQSWPEDSVSLAARGAWNRAIALWAHTDDGELSLDRVRHCRAWLALLSGEVQPTVPTSPDLTDPITNGDASASGAALTLSEMLAAGGVTSP